MLKKIPAALLAVGLALSMTAVSFDAADAKKGRNKAFVSGLALGILGSGVIRGEARGRAHCARGPVRCRWVREDCYYDRFDDLVCESRYRKCSRPLYCD